VDDNVHTLIVIVVEWLLLLLKSWPPSIAGFKLVKHQVGADSPQLQPDQAACGLFCSLCASLF
jgi:hypothetical protein